MNVKSRRGGFGQCIKSSSVYAASGWFHSLGTKASVHVVYAITEIADICKADVDPVHKMGKQEEILGSRGQWQSI